MATERRIAIDLPSLAKVRSFDSGEMLKRSGSEYVGVAGATLDSVSYIVNSTLPDAARMAFCDAGAGSFTLTLPLAANAANSPLFIKKIDATANTVTIDGNGSETIDDALTYVLEFEDEFVQLISDGSNWYVIGE